MYKAPSHPHTHTHSHTHRYRRAGLGESESVIAGLSQTGHIITAAGVIMAIAFSGLLLSTEAVLNQLAFLLVLAVLVDTFIVRSMLVPAIMSALGKLNWWPQKFKPRAPVKSVLSLIHI